MPPSRNKGTKGRELREAMIAAKERENDIKPTWRKLDEETVKRYYNELMEDLHPLGILAVLVNSVSPQRVEIEVHALEKCDQVLGEEKLAITGYFEDTIKPEIVWTTVMYASASPFCLGGGTGSVINCVGRVACITARHVLNVDSTAESVTVKYRATKNALSGRYPLIQDLKDFGVTNQQCIHAELDIAMVLPKYSMPLTVNHVDLIGDVRFAEIQLDDIKLNMEVQKNGCATGLTSAHISRKEDLVLEAVSDEIGPFAVTGDSGSLVITKRGRENIIIGLISYIYVKNEEVNGIPVFKYTTNIIPVWQWETWLEEIFQD